MGRGRGFLGALLLVAALPEAGAAQGWIEPLRGVDRTGFTVDKIRSEVRVRLDGRVALVEVSEWFRNEGRRAAEGHYLYPLPGEAVFQGFSLFQGDAELRGEIMDAKQARAIYEDIVRRRADPALIELAGQGLLRAQVFPIEPGEERRVTLRYTQVLARAGAALQFVYAGAVKGGVDRPSVQGVDVRRGPPEPAKTSFEVVAEHGDAYLDPFSPTHELEVRRDGGRLTVRVRGEVRGRMSLFLPLAGEAVGLSVATHRPAGEDGYFMLTLTPGRNADEGRAAGRDGGAGRLGFDVRREDRAGQGCASGPAGDVVAGGPFPTGRLLERDTGARHGLVARDRATPGGGAALGGRARGGRRHEHRRGAGRGVPGA